MGRESVEGLTEAHRRHDRMKRAVERLDAKIADLEREKGFAKPGEQSKIIREIRELDDERADARSLLAEAESALTAKRGQHDTAVADAIKGLGRIGRLCNDAATRFDRALREAAAALEEIEREAAPLENTLIPNGVRAFHLHQRYVNAAVAHAFADRLTGVLARAEQRPMRETVEGLLADARQNASQHKKHAAAMEAA